MISMKKIFAFLLALLLTCAVLVSCGNPAETGTTSPEETKADETENVRQLEKDSVPSDLNYSDLDDNTVTFFTRDHAVYGYEIDCETIENDTLMDAIHYRTIDLENRLGIELKTIKQAGRYAEYTTWFNTLCSSVLNKQHTFDAAAIYVNVGTPYALDGIYYNLTDLTVDNGGYLELDRPWWNQTLVENATVYDKLFFLGGDAAVSETSGTLCMFFNKDLFAEKFPEESETCLYDMVNGKTWTIDKLIGYVSQVHDDVNSDGELSDGDVVGYKNYFKEHSAELDGWIYALGIDLTVRNVFGEIEINTAGNTRIVPAYEKFLQLYNSTGTLKSPEGKEDDEQTNIHAGNCLFYEVEFSNGAKMRDSNVNYGVLPLPKYDEEQENYATSTSTNASVLVICSDASVEKATMVSAVFEVMASLSYQNVTPAYYNNVLTGVYSKDEIDAQMFDIVLASTQMPFEYIYNKSLSGLGNIFRSFDRDMQNYLDGKKLVWPQMLETLLTALEEVGQ